MGDIVRVINYKDYRACTIVRLNKLFENGLMDSDIYDYYEWQLSKLNEWCRNEDVIKYG